MNRASVLGLALGLAALTGCGTTAAKAHPAAGPPASKTVVPAVQSSPATAPNPARQPAGQCGIRIA